MKNFISYSLLGAGIGAITMGLIGLFHDCAEYNASVRNLADETLAKYGSITDDIIKLENISTQDKAVLMDRCQDYIASIEKSNDKESIMHNRAALYCLDSYMKEKDTESIKSLAELTRIQNADDEARANRELQYKIAKLNARSKVEAAEKIGDGLASIGNAHTEGGNI